MSLLLSDEDKAWVDSLLPRIEQMGQRLITQLTTQLRDAIATDTDRAATEIGNLITGAETSLQNVLDHGIGELGKQLGRIEIGVKLKE